MAVVGPDVSVERITSIIRVRTIGDLEANLALPSNRGTLRRWRLYVSPKRRFLTRATPRNIPEDDILKLISFSLYNHAPLGEDLL
jgi:hypothetical protein